MERVIGYWSWDRDTRTMHRTDGAAVHLLGVDEASSASGTVLGMRFEIATGCGRLELPVQQRLLGRDTNYRALWYKVDFRKAELAPDHWAVTERLIADALASWPRGDLLDGHPTGVGIVGGFSGGAFQSNLYRLYLPKYVGKPQFEGEIVAITATKRWTQSSVAGDDAVSLSSGPRKIILHGDGRVGFRLGYEDETFRSDRFVCGGQERSWWIFERGGSNEFLPDRSEGILERLIRAMRRNRNSKRDLERLPPEEQERAYTAFHDALFALSPAAIRSERLSSPPIVVRSTAPWRRAGYLTQDCLTASSLAGENLPAAFIEDLPAAFMDVPDAAAMLLSPAGAAFDAVEGVINGPDGSSLAIERVEEWLGLTPRRLVMRCRSSGLNWPIIVRRIDRRPKTVSWAYQPQLMSRWQIDHGECLEVWRREGHSGLPDADTWDTMRQFLEEAILSWGDGVKAGPAPQSLWTSGGWYDGQWRGSDLRRLLGRPIHTDQVTRRDNWMPYLPVTTWRRTDTTPLNEPDPPTHTLIGTARPPVWFAKASGGDLAAVLKASGHIIRIMRDEQTVRPLVDYHGGDDHIRLGGTRSRLATGGIFRIDKRASAPEQLQEFSWPPAAAIEQPNLQLWRRLRDAGESGLRKGEAMTVVGGYFFDRFYPGSLRITAYGQDVEDFDYRMFGRGNDFADGQ